jgi:glutathione synthase/RimK-type ligase-like ATP-grasp enzyme
MVLLFGPAADPPLAAVKRALAGAGVPCFLLDQNRPSELELEVDAEGRTSGSIRDGERTAALADIEAVFLRPHDPRQLPRWRRLGPSHEEVRRALVVDEAVMAWADTAELVVLNRPSAMVANHSKPYQSALIERAGFETPPTLITTDPEAAREFVARHGHVIYKSVSGVRSIVARVGEPQLARLDQVAHCPTQFQAWIPGVDVRVHVVGDAAFACEVRSGATDYRYPCTTAESPDVREIVLPPPVLARCVAMTHEMGLLLSGIDLRRTPDERWVCFEVNPSPAFTFYENATGQPLTSAVAALLGRASG